MRAFSRELGKYCTVVSSKQLRDAKALGIPEAKITVEFHQNIHEQKVKPFYKTMGRTQVSYGQLKF